MRKQLGEFLSRVGIGWGTSFNGSLEYELRGSRPRPLVTGTSRLDYEWDVGLPWYLKNLQGPRVLDTGFVEHLEFTKLLVRLGFEVYGIDIKAFDSDKEGFTSFKEYVWKTPFVDGYLDLIVANSLFEHLGLKCYGQPEFSGAQQATAEEFRRVLKPNGVLLMQVPYGMYSILVKSKGVDFYRVLTRGALFGLLKGLEIENKTFYVRSHKGWVEVSESIANKVKIGGSLPNCLAYIKAVKRDE